MSSASSSGGPARFKKGGKPGPGRPKNTPNKTTQQVKDAILAAAEGLGGVDRLIAWAKEDNRNEAAFWVQVYPKLLPVQVAGEGKDGQIIVEIVRYANTAAN
jgi:hypothetical protein